MRSYNFLIAGFTAQTPTKTSRTSPPATLIKAKSASHVPTMASIATPPTTNGSLHTDADNLNTIPDPRTPSPSQQMRNSTDATVPDLSNEVSMLSTKLINAINHSTNLDDSLQQSRHELEAARQRIALLEIEAKERNDAITQGVLVKKAEVDANMAQLRAELAEARREREASDKSRKQMEIEVENLTSALFEEANTVSTPKNCWLWAMADEFRWLRAHERTTRLRKSATCS